VVPQYDATFSTNGAFKPTVRVQYLLPLGSPLGQVEGAGWYEAGSYASFTVRPAEISKGLAQLVGVTLFLDHWIDENGNGVASGSLQMNSSHALRASWSARLADWRPTLIIVVLIVAAVLSVESRRKRPRKEPGLQ
jgi:hypothetical protein